MKIDLLKMIVAVLLSTVVAGMTSYLAFATERPTRGDVRTMITEEQEPVLRELANQLQMLERIEQRQHDDSDRLAGIDKRLGAIEAELSVLGTFESGPR